MEDSFIVAGVFTYDHEAHLFAGRLESEGIQAFIADNNIVAANPFLSNAVGGIKVRIYKKDLEKSRAIFAEDLSLEEKHLSKPEIDFDGKSFEPVIGSCPNCDSKNVFVQKFSWWKWIVSILTFSIVSFAVPPPFRIKKFCADCKHLWKH